MKLVLNIILMSTISLMLVGAEKFDLLKTGMISVLSKGKVKIMPGPGAEVRDPLRKGSSRNILKEGSFDRWTELSFTVEPEQEENLFIILNAPNHPARPEICYGELKVAERKFENPDFSQELKFWGVGGRERGEIIKDSRLGDGSYLKVNRDQSTYRRFIVKPGEKLSVKVMFRPVGISKVPAGSYDLRPYANMGYADDVAGDGKGGWSDQGPENDMRNFSPFRKEFCGILFDVIDPVQNNGKSVVVFDSPNLQTELKTIRLKKKSEASRYLYLLNSSAWTGGKVMGSVMVRYDDGTEETHKIEKNKHSADWSIENFDTEHGKIAYTAKTPMGNRHIFISRIVLKEKPISELVVSGEGKNVWMLLGITASNKNWILKQASKLECKVGREWKKPDFPSRNIIAGSAIDLSGQVDSAPCGTYGKVIRKGDHLVFEKRPNDPIRFFGVHTAGQPTTDFEPDEKIYVEQVRRTGHNAIRLNVHRLSGEYWMSPEKNRKRFQYENGGKGLFIEERIRKFCRMVAELNKQGVYLLISTSLGGKHNSILAGDPKCREEFREELLTFLHYVNPYTNRRIMDEPCVIGVQLCNELSVQHLTDPSSLQHAIATGKSAIKLTLKKWHEWLKKEYGNDFAKLKEKYRKEAENFKDFDSMPLPEKYTNNTVLAHDFQIFSQMLMEDMFAYFKELIRESGYKGPVSWGNFDKILRVTESRTKPGFVSEVNVYNSYQIGNRIAQHSALGNAVIPIRDVAGSRIPGSPMLVTEWNDNNVNHYFHHLFAAFPAYSALQGFSGIFTHIDTVWTDGNTKIFDPYGVHRVANSPMARAGIFLAACLYGRGDVSEAKHKVVLEFSRDFMNKISSNGYPNAQLTRIALMTGLFVDFPHITGGKAEADLKLPGFGNDSAGFLVSLQSQSTDSSTGKNILDNAIGLMKKKNILPASNRSNAEKGIFESETGELLLETHIPRMRIVTGRTEVISLPQNGSAEAKHLKVARTSADSTVAAASVDGKPLEKSSRIVLLFFTETGWEGSVTNPDRSFYYKLPKNRIGGTPSAQFLLHTGKVTLLLANKSGKNFTLYPLSVNGIRRDPIPIKQKDGILEISIDTEKLKHGVTPFFELTENK